MLRWLSERSCSDLELTLVAAALEVSLRFVEDERLIDRAIVSAQRKMSGNQEILPEAVNTMSNSP
jgi:hypothetical protein